MSGKSRGEQSDRGEEEGEERGSIRVGERPTWDIQIRSVDILPWRLPAFHLTSLVPPNLPGPGLVSPGEEDQSKFKQYIGVGDCE
jgi:hypothetical protein